MTGLEVEDECSLFSKVQELAVMREKYLKIEEALRDVEEKGYGIVMPSAEEMKFDEPKLVIIIFDYALCSTGLEVEGKNKENGVFKATFECYAELSSEADILPYHIYTPKVTV